MESPTSQGGNKCHTNKQTTKLCPGPANSNIRQVIGIQKWLVRTHWIFDHDITTYRYNQGDTVHQMWQSRNNFFDTASFAAAILESCTASLLYVRKTKNNTIYTLHTQSKKAKPTAAMQNTAITKHWDACAPLRRLSLVQANPPGAGLSRSHGERLWPQQPQHCYMRQGQLGICFPSKYQVPIDVTAG